MLQVTAISLIKKVSFNIFKRGAVASGVDIESKISFKTVGLETERLQNGERVLTIVFKMASSGLYYITLITQAFEKYVCDWIGLVNDCYDLHVSTLYGRSTTFNPDLSLEKGNESDEEINTELNVKELPQSRQTRNVNCADQIIPQYVTDSCRDLIS